MADNNLEFTVKLKNEGVDKLADGLAKVDQKVDALGDSAKEASQDLTTLDSATAAATDELNKLATAEDAAEKQAGELATGATTAGQGVKALASSAATAGSDLKTLGNAESTAKQQAEELAKGASSAGQGVEALADAAASADGDLNTLAGAEKEVKAQAQELGTGTKAAGESVKGLGSSAGATSDDLQKLSAAIAQKTQAIKSGLVLEQSEIDLQRQHLTLASQQQQTIAQVARAKGDEAAATLADNRVRQIEIDQLALTARAKRAEASAIQGTVDARRQELAAVGPLTAAQQRELQTSENLAKSLRVQAAAADSAAQRVSALGDSTQQAAQKTEAFPGVLTKVAGAVAGAFAIDRVIQFGKSVNAVSDEYKNLESKLRLAIGAQGDLAGAVQGVGTIAKDTYSNLDATVQLYSRLASSAKELNITNAEALALTKSINQAIQIGGASAQASEASVRQLIQGLQSGVIRGDEFNSIMEQAPRLAKAMADGLGVPITALRGLAEQGQITSAKVVAALKGQSDAINKEFATIPLTTGRALENLNTQWTLFVGKLAGGAQQSSVVAQGIALLANNLETLAAVAARGGAVLTAALAIQGVQALKAFSLEMASTGKAASLMSLELSKVPKVINITVAAVGLEVGYQIGEMLAENSALARQFGVGLVGFFRLLVNDLQLLKEAAAAVFTSDTVDAALDRYVERNKQIGANLKDMFADAEKAPAKVAAAADSATGSLGQLGGAGGAAGQALAAGGAAGAAGVSKVGKAADDARGALTGLAETINTAKPVDSFKDIVQNLTAAKSRGVDLVKLLRDELPPAIDKLSGTELAKFRTEFIRAMDEAGIKGKALQAGLVLIGEQAAKSLGVDVVAASSKMGSEFVQANEKMRLLILSMPALKAAGVDTGQVVGEALSKMLDGAKNKAEIDAVLSRVQALRKELGDKVADGLLDQAKQKTEQLKEALDKAKPGINSVAEAMKQLGITSDQSLKDTAKTAKESYDLMVTKGTSSARELAEGFRKSADAAITANNGIAPSWVTAQAAARGFELQVDSAGKAILKAMGDGSAAVDKLTGSVQGGTKAIQEQLSWLERLNKRNSEVGQLPPAGRRAANGEELGEGVTEIGSNGQYRNRQGMASDAKGTTLGASTELGTLTGIAAFLKAAGVSDDAAARKIALEFSDGKGDIPYLSNPGQKKYGGDTMSMAVLKAAERYTFGQSGSGMQSPSAIPKPESQTTPAPTSAQDNRLQAARSAYPNAQGSTPEEVIFNGTKAADATPAPTSTPAPASTVTYVVRIEQPGKAPLNANFSTDPDAQGFISFLQSSKQAAGL